MMDMKYCIISYFGRASDLKWESKIFPIRNTLRVFYLRVSIYVKISVSDLTNAELKIKKAYCHDILSVLNTLGSGNSIKKGNMISIA
jgi:hypothetical protein